MKRTVVLRTPFFVSNALNGLYLKSIQTNHHLNTCYSQVGFRVGRDSAVKYLVLQVDHDDCDDDNDDGGDSSGRLQNFNNFLVHNICRVS